MDIPQKKVNDVCLVSLSGRLDAYGSNDVERKLDSLINEAEVRLVVNFGNLDYISSSGLRVLLAALKRVRRQQGNVKLVAPKPYVKEVFDIAGFTQFFSMFDTEDAAVAAFKRV